MSGRSVRLSVRGVVVHEDKLLLVNAWASKESDLWCVPGGGVEVHQSLPDNLIREIHEETGLTVAVGDPVLVNEFHDPDGDFHQVDVYFRCTLVDGALSDAWTDPEGVVHARRFVSEEEFRGMRVKPDSLHAIVWGGGGLTYDPLEPLVR